MAAPPYTLLAIDAIDFSQYAVRGITMTLEPIDQAASMARDCRGDLADISLAQFRQYKVTVTCTDHEVPELTDVWPGQDITITCTSPALLAAPRPGMQVMVMSWPGHTSVSSGTS